MMLRTGSLLCALLLGLAAAGGPALVRSAVAQPGGAANGGAGKPVPLPPVSPVRQGLDTEALKADVSGAEAFQKTLAAELEAAKGDRAKLNGLLVATAGRSRAVEQQLIDVEGRITQLDASAGELSASLAKRRDVLAEVLAALLRMGREPPPALLMRPDDALDAVRSAILLGALLPELRVEAETLAADLSELVRVRGELADAKTRLGQLRLALDQDQKRLAALVGERQRRRAEEQPVAPAEKAEADQVASQVAKGSGDVHDLVTRLETEVGPAARAADAATVAATAQAVAKPDLTALKNPARIAPAVAFDQAKGLLPLPVAGVALRGFGAADDVGGTTKGLTIATRAGAPVSAPADGWVVYAGPFRSYGQLLIINAGGGYHILMAGMEKITVDLGQFVLAGEPVAVMGGLPRAGAGPGPRSPESLGSSLGTASGQPQLYVEFRKDGVSIDPAPWWAATDSRKVRG